MFKNKTWLLGLGLGIMIGALLLQLMLKAGAESDPQKIVSPGGETLSEAKLKEQAEQLGYKLVDESETVYNRQQLDEELNKQKDKLNQETKKQLENEKATVVVIRSGYTLSEVGQLVEAAGLVRSSDEFVQAMKERRLATKIRSGTFAFKGKPSINMIIEKLTTPPKK